MKKLIIASVLALASSAYAADFAAGDLVLGFKVAGGTGSASNVVVDLGAVTGFTGALDTVANASGLGSVLTSTYGSNWATRSDLQFGVFSAVSLTRNANLWASQAESASGVLQTNVTGAYSSSALVTGKAAFQNFTSNASLLTAAAGTTHVYVQDSSVGNSWQNQEGSSVSFAVVSPTIDGVMASATANAKGVADHAQYSVLDLYKLTSTGNSFVGGFGLSSAGNVAFQTDVTQFQAIPEPSTYAAILGALTVGFVALRRRFSKAV